MFLMTSVFLNFQNFLHSKDNVPKRFSFKSLRVENGKWKTFYWSTKFGNIYFFQWKRLWCHEAIHSTSSHNLRSNSHGTLKVEEVARGFRWRTERGVICHWARLFRGRKVDSRPGSPLSETYSSKFPFPFDPFSLNIDLYICTKMYIRDCSKIIVLLFKFTLAWCIEWIHT